MRIFKHLFPIAAIFPLFIILLAGCAEVKEVCKGVAGVSTKVLEDNRKDALKKEFNYDLITCHSKVKNILKQTGAYIYADDLQKDMIAIYITEEDTTPVGIFLTERGKDTTLIEVSSPSTYGREKISKAVFDALRTGIINPPEKGLFNAEKAKAHNKEPNK